MNQYVIIFALSFGLAMDAVAVSMVCGFLSGKKWFAGVKISLFFGFFQGMMPIAGYFIGYSFYSLIKNYDHWIAFFALAFIGGHMIFESLKNEEISDRDRYNIDSLKTLLVLSLSTSLDAFMCGISLPYIGLRLFISASIIAGITFLLSFMAYLSGRKLYSLFGKKIEIMGGIILILIGLKTLSEHI